jgi:hypothetical protein
VQQKILKGQSTEFEKTKNWLKGQRTKNHAVLAVALEVFCWTKNNSEHINIDSKKRRIFCATKNLKGTVNRVEKQFCFCGPRKKVSLE